MTADDPRRRIAIHSGLAGIGYLSWRGWRHARLDMFEALRLAHELGDPASSAGARPLGLLVGSLGRPWRHLMSAPTPSACPFEAVPTLEHPDLQFAGSSAPRRRSRGAPTAGAARSSAPVRAATGPACRDCSPCWPRSNSTPATWTGPSGSRARRYAGILQTGEGAFHQDLLPPPGPRVLRGDVEAARALGADVEPDAEASPHRWFRATVPVSLAMLELSLGEPAAAYERLSPGSCPIPGLGRLAPAPLGVDRRARGGGLVGLGRGGGPAAPGSRRATGSSTRLAGGGR